MFVLILWDTHRRGEYGKHVFAYRLSMGYWSCYGIPDGDVVLFEGEDFETHYKPDSACFNDDSLVRGIMGFLTLRPGDTDTEYFADYTPEQLDYCARYAEALSCEVTALYGEV